MKKSFEVFADMVIDASFSGSSLDPMDIENFAEKCGLLEEKEIQSPCCDECTCEEIGLIFPVRCMRKTYK